MFNGKNEKRTSISWGTCAYKVTIFSAVGDSPRSLRKPPSPKWDTAVGINACLETGLDLVIMNVGYPF